jgi:hypothetical protein
MKLTITFGGGAWYVMFYLGVAQYVAEHARPEVKHLMRFAGCSAGSSAATALALGISPEKISEDLITASRKCKRNIFKTCESVHDVAIANVPFDDALCASASNRLLVGLAEYVRPLGFKKAIKHTFSGRDDILQSLKASCNVPLMGGMSPVIVDGKPCYDANLCYNWTSLPTFPDSDKTIRVTAKSSWYLNNGRDGWISPRMRIPRMWQLFPPKPDALRKLYRLGYLRAWEYASDSGKHFFRDGPSMKEELDAFHF